MGDAVQGAADVELRPGQAGGGQERQDDQGDQAPPEEPTPACRAWGVYGGPVVLLLVRLRGCAPGEDGGRGRAGVLVVRGRGRQGGGVLRGSGGDLENAGRQVGAWGRGPQDGGVRLGRWGREGGRVGLLGPWDGFLHGRLGGIRRGGGFPGGRRLRDCQGAGARGGVLGWDGGCRGGVGGGCRELLGGRGLPGGVRGGGSHGCGSRLADGLPPRGRARRDVGRGRPFGPGGVTLPRAQVIGPGGIRGDAGQGLLTAPVGSLGGLLGRDILGGGSGGAGVHSLGVGGDHLGGGLGTGCGPGGAGGGCLGGLLGVQRDRHNAPGREGRRGGRVG